ncbi:hypothetical protein LNKW23_37510 [Paralimibaculum aggregatum]|uniref:Uncharacterized protein n=1 Tax=Paralimibaculum aggregatum TaxID=3036245 RepID=A0ABQ6LS65_9RHOB|nr:hypothetical protein LNKW23_37510 [Limibaculum sp. NKW23]
MGEHEPGERSVEPQDPEHPQDRRRRDDRRDRQRRHDPGAEQGCGRPLPAAERQRRGVAEGGRIAISALVPSDESHAGSEIIFSYCCQEEPRSGKLRYCVEEKEITGQAKLRSRIEERTGISTAKIRTRRIQGRAWTIDQASGMPRIMQSAVVAPAIASVFRRTLGQIAFSKIATWF